MLSSYMKFLLLNYLQIITRSGPAGWAGLLSEVNKVKGFAKTTLAMHIQVERLADRPLGWPL